MIIASVGDFKIRKIRRRGKHAGETERIRALSHKIHSFARFIRRFQRGRQKIVIVDPEKHVAFCEFRKEFRRILLRQTTRHYDFFQFSVFITRRFQYGVYGFFPRGLQERAGIDHHDFRFRNVVRQYVSRVFQYRDAFFAVHPIFIATERNHSEFLFFQHFFSFLFGNGAIIARKT